MESAALLRVETWPFLLGAGAVAWRRRPEGPPAAGGGGRPGSRRLARQTAEARATRCAPVRGPGSRTGQPALASTCPRGAARGGGRALARLGWTRVAGPGRRAPTSRRRAALALAGAGVAWIALVAFMAHAGFSGEPRYAPSPGRGDGGDRRRRRPGDGAAGDGTSGRARRRPRAGDAARAVATRLAPPAWPSRCRASRRGPARRGGGARGAPPAHAATQRRPSRSPSRWAPCRRSASCGGCPPPSSVADLAGAIRAAGGRDAVLRCGRPYVRPPRPAAGLSPERRQAPGRARRPAGGGVVFRSARREGGPASPDPPPAFQRVARAGLWEVLSTCPC